MFCVRIDRFRIVCLLILFLLNINAVVAVTLERVAFGFSTPLYVTAPNADTTRLFVLEKESGAIKILNPITGGVNQKPFLIVQNISSGGERGLLGLAFHPQYASQENDVFFVNLTNRNGDTEIRKYRLSANPDIANANSGELVMRFTQPYSNHNGGWIGFGPDGYLYIASGDGGSGEDPDNNGQSNKTLLGKMLRIDVNSDAFTSDPARNYAIPDDNPYKGVGGLVKEEIWALGLRNPWRVSFDRLKGDLLIADVGQGSREEINFQAASSPGGENYGWRLREGLIATPGSAGGAKPDNNVDPIYDYPHGNGAFEGASVTGGYVYRGPIAAIRGKYFFSDFVNSRIWSIKVAAGGASELTDWTDELVPDVGRVNNIASFGEDAAGNLYIVDFDGEIFRLRASDENPSPPTGDMVVAPIIYLLL